MAAWLLRCFGAGERRLSFDGVGGDAGGTTTQPDDGDGEECNAQLHAVLATSMLQSEICCLIDGIFIVLWRLPCVRVLERIAHLHQSSTRFAQRTLPGCRSKMRLVTELNIKLSYF